MDCYKLKFSTYTQLQNFISHHNEFLELRQHNINKFVVLPNNIIKRGQTYYKFSSTEHPEELNGISQQKGKLSKLPDKPKNILNAYKLYLED